ncbi:cobyric acid synthase [Reichenbachiella versicolor]|uniref:cobyric acid synthase n=1 Tax=Reichenbachiella versicolor TaxID=1821036 RepID=UPI001C886329|nr:cobyric acid synthase [Reichenbachiella versicolor]
MKNLRPIMLVGTGSDVGKSWMTAGICRWLKNHDYSPAPFKAQNMSLNSFSTPDGLELGRAQAVQAEASKIAPMVEMNPILLKPSSQNRSQVVVYGKPIGDQTAKEYFSNNKLQLFEEAKRAFHILEDSYQPVVMEGAGSISELNLKKRDIVNMRMARAANACVYLIADIDRGGIFGSVYGTIELLEEWERKLIKGIIINKFRGDISLFEEGREMLENLTGVPVLGVMPYASDIVLEEEDSVALNGRAMVSMKDKLNVAIIHLHYMSNYTDFQSLEQEPLINAYFTRDHEEVRRADVIILPGTKNTIEDLLELRREGIAEVIHEMYDKVPIIGICGGYQMMGKSIADPYQVESDKGIVDGLGIFDIKTVLTKDKTTVQQSFTFKSDDQECVGYEIHMGETTVPNGKHLNIVGGKPEGYFDGKQSWGTYLHGILDNQIVVNELLRLKFKEANALNYLEFKEVQYEKLADWIDEHLDMGSIIENSRKDD